MLARFDARPQPMALFMVAVLIVGAATGLSSWGAAIAARAPLGAIVLVQSFRLPLELAMHDAATRGIMPVELSFLKDSALVLIGVVDEEVVADLQARRSRTCGCRRCWWPSPSLATSS